MYTQIVGLSALKEYQKEYGVPLSQQIKKALSGELGENITCYINAHGSIGICMEYADAYSVEPSEFSLWKPPIKLGEIYE